MTEEEKKEEKNKHHFPFKLVVLGCGLFLIVLLVFAAGMTVGLGKARFSSRFGENYERNFIGPPRGPMPKLGPDLYRNSYGLSGKILKIDANNLVIEDKNKKENMVVVTDKTMIKYLDEDIKVANLKVDDQVVVMGSPTEKGTIEARLIRVFR